ncbi:uncharacterized protein ColSpa_12364 [Colletotrichum spaethianum]|uniref:Uncharacterized protein n=1 Tax=Colletotrichum spaethianum TaxID=700344 RepID=A0AA37PHB4_9PEZI|nr:uncharacterized protein ColSpa_12364 [Colletotrichum spaethianum]GKT52183.1 hypothetical protein ColSpa_12364 [Colletotrichum spaethianum]
MRFLTSLVLFCSVALGAPHPSPDIAAEFDPEQPSKRAANEATSTAAVFKVEKLYAGGQAHSDWNYGSNVTPGAAFAECSIATNSGPKVPTIEKTACRNATSVSNAIKWSLEPTGTGMMHFNVWWQFTGHGHLYGGVHMYQSWFKEWTLQDGSKVQEYVGPREFTLETTMSSTQPGEKRGMEGVHM